MTDPDNTEGDVAERADAESRSGDEVPVIEFPSDPVTRQGNHSITGPMAETGTAAFLPDEAGWQTEKYAETIRKLPADHPARIRASVVNYLSCLEIRGRPPGSDETLDAWTSEDWEVKAFLIIEAISFREELLHGERQQFGLTRNVYLLKALAREELLSLLSNDGSQPAPEEIRTTTKRILRLRATAMRLIAAKSQFIEAVDKHLMDAVLQEESGEEDRYLREVATEYVDHFADATVEDIVAFLRCAINFDRVGIETEASDYVDSEIVRSLDRITDDYGREVAEAAADVALDVPHIDPVLAEIVQTVPYVDDAVATKICEAETAQFDADEIRERFETVTDTLERIPITETMARDDIRSRLRSELAEQHRPLHDLELPLLDTPRSVTSSAGDGEAGYAVMQEAPTAVARLLSGGFNYIGDFGGIIYRDETNTRHLLINSWVHDQQVNPVVARTTDSELSYPDLWYRSYFADAVIEYLMYLVLRWEADPTVFPDDTVTVDKLPQVPCPFCELMDGADSCGTDQCRSASIVGRLNDIRADLVDGIRVAGRDRYGENYWQTAESDQTSQFDQFERFDEDLSEGRWHPFEHHGRSGPSN